jgi:hypothetical protein
MAPGVRWYDKDGTDRAGEGATTNAVEEMELWKKKKNAAAAAAADDGRTTFLTTTEEARLSYPVQKRCMTHTMASGRTRRLSCSRM